MNQVILASPNRRVRGIFNSQKDAREFQEAKPDWTEEALRCKKCGLLLEVVDGLPHKCPHF
jgi:uncharacterized protein YbaR (Trm112 family)